MGTWSKIVKNEPNENQGGGQSWSGVRENLDQVEEQAQFEKSYGEVALDTVVEDVKDVPENLSKYGAIQADIIRSTAAGLYKAGGDLSGLISSAGEVVYDSGRAVGREAYKAYTDTPEYDMESWKETDYFSRNFKETTERDVKAIAGENQGTIGEYVQKVSEYAGFTQALTRKMLAKGKALNAVPTVISSSTIPAFFEKSMMNAAKNPQATIKMEQGVSALIASSGETAKQLGIPPTGQLLTELATGLLSGNIINSFKSISNFISKKIPGSAKRIGKIRAAEYIQEVAKSDPRFVEKLDAGLKLQAETGVKMNVAELTNNPELKAALQYMEVHTAGTMTELEARLAQQTKDIKKAFPVDSKKKLSSVKGVDDYLSQTEVELEKIAKREVDNVLEQVDNVAPLDNQSLGETGQNALNAAREKVSLEVNRLYKEVGNPNIPTNKVITALREAKKSPLVNDSYMKELDADLVSTLESNLLGKQGAPKIIEAPVKTIYLGRGTDKIPTEISLDGMRVIEGRLKEKIRIANAGGKLNEARLLNKILRGVFDQYKTATGIEAHQIANLKKAAAASKRMHEIFDQGEVLLQSKVDVKGMERITTEGFVRNFVKPNSSTATARTEEAVDGFYNAYGNMPEAKEWMVNAFGSLLKKEVERQGEKINPVLIKKFINKHSAFLKKARIEGRFDNVSKAIAEANRAEFNKVISLQVLKKTAMSKFVGSDDPINFIMNASQTERLPKLMAEIDKIPNKPKRDMIKTGVREALWEGMQRKLTQATTADGDEILLNTGTVRKMMDDLNYGKQLKQGLGDSHYGQLRKLLDVIDRVSPEISTSAGLPKEHIDEKLAEKLMTGLRAAAHGFVRPDLIAAQMSMRGYRAVTTKEAHRILKEAMNNPDMTKELLKLSTSINGRNVLGTMFSPLASPIVSSKPDE